MSQSVTKGRMISFNESEERSTMSIATALATKPGGFDSEFFKKVHALSRDEKEMLIIWLQEELDGGPFVGDLPEQPAENQEKVESAWKETIARRIDDMKSDRVERIDAH